ncbi:MAG: hypothetical protein JWN76_1515 [Chitinophagaceae bacterium]|nr:hypothetical protein [Chitinophagaceae bacterium]
MIKKLKFLSAFIFCSLAIAAQQTAPATNENYFLTDAEGRLLTDKSPYKVEGTNTFPELNCNAIVKTKTGNLYKDIQGRIDLIKNEFIFSVGNKELICTLPVEEVLFDGCSNSADPVLFRTGYPSIDQQNAKTYYQVLCEGRISLLKNYKVAWRDDKPFNSGTITRIFTTREILYLYMDGKIFKLEKNRSNLVDILASLNAHSFIAREKLNLKNESDLVKLVKYCNTL